MKKLIVLVIIIILISLSVGVYLWLNNASRILSQQEKEAALINILGRKPILNDNTPAGNVQYKDKYLSFYYPKKARIYAYKEPNIAKNITYVDLFSFDITNPRLIFNFSVKESIIPALNFSDIPDVKLRQLPEMGYNQKDLQSDGQKGIVFEKTTGKIEKTGFFIVNNRIFSFLVTGNDIKDVSQLFDSIVSTIIFVR